MAEDRELTAEFYANGSLRSASVSLKKDTYFIITTPTPDYDDTMGVVLAKLEENSWEAYSPLIVDGDVWYELFDAAEFGEQAEEIADGLCWVFGDGPVDIVKFHGSLFPHALPPDQEVVSLDWPRIWDLLRFILPKTLRSRVFMPAYCDLLADHLETRQNKYQGPWARRWIKLCFAARTGHLVLQCAAVGLRSSVGAILIGAIPVSVAERVREWWRGP